MNPLPARATAPPPLPTPPSQAAQPVLDYQCPPEQRRDEVDRWALEFRAALREIGRAILLIAGVAVGIFAYTLAVAAMSS